MLPSTFLREALLACPPSPPWNLPPFTVVSTLFLHAPALIPHSLCGTHSPHHLVLSTDGSVSVPFPFGKGNYGILANCSLCGTESTLSFLARPVCSSFSAEACAILQALCWSRQHHKSATCFLLLSDSCSVLTTLSSLPSFFFPQSLWQELSSLSFCSIRLQWVPVPRNDVADELARWGALLMPSAILCILPPLISRIRSSLFSDWRHMVSSKFFDMHVPRFLPRNLCSLVMLNVFSLVFAAMNTAFC